MCKRILDVIQTLHKEFFKRKHSTITNGNVREAIFNHICYELPTLYEKRMRKHASLIIWLTIGWPNVKAAMVFLLN